MREQRHEYKGRGVDQQLEVKQYKVQYPVSAYTFSREACIHRVGALTTSTYTST